MIVAAQLWVRGTETSFNSRSKIALNRFNNSNKLVLTFLLNHQTIARGSFIYYNTTTLNLFSKK